MISQMQEKEKYMARFVDVYEFNDDMEKLENSDNLIKIVEVDDDNFTKYHDIDKEIDLADYIVKGEEKQETKKRDSNVVDAEYEIVDDGEREDGQFADLKFDSEYNEGLEDIVDAETIDALKNECGI